MTFCKCEKCGSLLVNTPDSKVYHAKRCKPVRDEVL